MIKIQFDLSNKESFNNDLIKSKVTKGEFFSRLNVPDLKIPDMNFYVDYPDLLPYPIKIYNTWSGKDSNLGISSEDIPDIFRVNELLRLISEDVSDNNLDMKVFDDFHIIEYSNDIEKYSFNCTACCYYHFKGIKLDFFHEYDGKLMFKCKNLGRDILIYHRMFNNLKDNNTRDRSIRDFYKNYSRFYIGFPKESDMKINCTLTSDWSVIVDHIGDGIFNSKEFIDYK